jgi:exosortase
VSKSKRRKPQAIRRPSDNLAREKTSPQVIDVTSRPVPTAPSGDLWLAGVALGALFFWSFWPQLTSLVKVWSQEPDYSHGFLVPVIAGLFLWFRRDKYPGPQRVPQWSGLLLLACSMALFVAGKRYFLTPLLNWALIVWIAAICWIFWGRRVFWWASPAIVFLFFMVPLPFRLENLLSWPLQRVATKLSCWILQLLGQPAIAEGNTILLGGSRLEVEQACSGLRMLVMIAALTMAFGVLVCRNWPERLFLIACMAPVALFSNSIRIVVTGLGYEYLSDEASQTLSHDLAGFIVVLVAATSMGLALCYWRWIFIEEEEGSAVPRQAPNPRPAVSH